MSEKNDDHILRRIWPWIIFLALSALILRISYILYFSYPLETSLVPAQTSLRDWIMLLFSDTSLRPTGDLNQMAQKGDMFGAFTSIYTGIAFAGLVTTMILQQKELALQRKELRATSDAMRKQNKHLEKQAFESTFFQMLDVFNKYIEAISIDCLGQSTTGRNAIPLILRAKVSAVDHTHQLYRTEELRSYLERTFSLNTFDDQLEKIKVLEAEHLAISRSYFRVLANLIELVDTSMYFAQFPDAKAKLKKRKYTDIIRAQLSEAEVGLLLIHFHSNSSHKNWPRYIKDYKLLEFGPKEYPNGSDRLGMIQQCRDHRRPD